MGGVRGRHVVKKGLDSKPGRSGGRNVTSIVANRAAAVPECEEECSDKARSMPGAPGRTHHMPRSILLERFSLAQLQPTVQNYITYHDIAPHGSPLGEYSTCVAALCSNGVLEANSAGSMALEGGAANGS